MDQKPYKLATLNNCGGDVAKRWYINFWIWHDIKKKLIRKRVYGMNIHKGKAERTFASMQMLAEINELLKAGHYISKQKEKKATGIDCPQGLSESFDAVILVKAKVLRSSSISAYKTAAGEFSSFIKDNWAGIQINEIEHRHALLFSDYLLSVKNLSAQTRNNYITNLKALFAEMNGRYWVNQNPFLKLKQYRVAKSTKNRAFDDNEKKKIIQEIKKDPGLWLCVQLIYYCFLRTKEVRNIKISDLDLKLGVIRTRAEWAKNKKSESVKMSAAISETLKGMQLQNYPKNFFILSKTGIPSSLAVSRNTMTIRHKKIRDRLGFDKDLTLYSWKHTGVVAAYKSGADLKKIQRQCRHHSIEETDTYLKSLGLSDHSDLTGLVPEL